MRMSDAIPVQPQRDALSRRPQPPLAVRNSSVAVQHHVYGLARIILLPLIATSLLWLMSANEITLLQWLAAFILLLASWGSYCKWSRRKVDNVPLFPMIAFMYWLYYAFPLFWGTREAVSMWNSGLNVSDEAVTSAMVMSVLGVIALWLGIKSKVGRRWSPRYVPDIPPQPIRWNYLRFILIIGSLLSFYEELPGSIGGDWAQLPYIFQKIVPLVAFAILFRNYLQGKASRFDKLLILLFLALRFLVGMSSGWLGDLVYVMITCAAIYIVEKRRIPRFAVAVLIIYVLFFQVGKFSVREKYWYGQEEGSKIERIAFWVNESFNEWSKAVSDPTVDTLKGIAYVSLSRVALLTQTANVLEMTPATVPYQYGSLYSYIVVSLIPRFVWPDKPSANDANRFYQVAYGITAEEDLNGGSFAVGVLPESYINFGWFGVVGIMFLVGIFLDFFQGTFLAETSGVLLRGIGVVLIPFFLSIEAQLAVYTNGTVQRVLLTLVVLSPIIRFRKRNLLHRARIGKAVAR